MFTKEDLAQIENRGSDLHIVEQQIENFKNGFPFLKLTKAATIDKGIIKLSEEELATKIRLFEESVDHLQIEKFVPASGAASRMFKALFSLLSKLKDDPEAAIESIKKDDNLQSLYHFFSNIDKFAYFKQLKDLLKSKSIELQEALANKDYKSILEGLLHDEGLSYGSLPKGLLLFHNYEVSPRTPVEEHLVEGANYSKGAGNIAKLHLTVSPEHKSKFEEHVLTVKERYEKDYDVQYKIEFSEQKPKTDTIAVDLSNEPFRDRDGKLFFRPGGHGALIENLNDIDADIIFIKNIDNVVPDSLKEDTFTYKKALAGLLLEKRNKIFFLLKEIESGDEGKIEDALAFIGSDLCVENIPSFASEADKKEWVLAKLNRPARVCGMVKNEGEPGGGPFFAVNPDGTYSLQIVEGSQIDPNEDAQQTIVAGATHFNPVDLVCSVRDHNGSKFDLTQFVDPQTGFISEKSKDGKDLKAQELPGLWNGAMSDWNTFFMEVPISTFNPVKTVNDLLRSTHQ